MLSFIQVAASLTGSAVDKCSDTRQGQGNTTQSIKQCQQQAEQIQKSVSPPIYSDDPIIPSNHNEIQASTDYLKSVVNPENVTCDAISADSIDVEEIILPDVISPDSLLESQSKKISAEEIVEVTDWSATEQKVNPLIDNYFILYQNVTTSEQTTLDRELEQSKSVEISAKDELDMPEIKDGDGKDEINVSPSLLTANCRIRWAKTISTNARKVLFTCLNRKIDPVALVWSDPAECFYSEEINLPCGTYQGSLVVDCMNYPLENITIKYYTFEVDLYTKDDIIEDEVDKSGLTKAEEFLQRELKSRDIDTYQDINTELTGHKMESRNSESSGAGIHISSKYQELVRQQMSQSKNLDSLDTEMEVDPSVKSDHSEHSSGRHTPVGEDGIERFVDNDDTFLKQLKDHANGFDFSRNDALHTSLVDDDVEKPDSNHSSHSSLKDVERLIPHGSSINNVCRTPTQLDNPVLSRHSSVQSLHNFGSDTSEIIGDVISEPSRVAINHGERSHNSSTPHTSIRHELSADMFSLDDRRTSRDGSYSSARQTPLSQQRNSAGSPSVPMWGEGSLHSSARQTPDVEQIDDVLNPSDRHSPFKFDYISLPQTHVQSVAKETITDKFHSNPEKLYRSHKEVKQMNSSLESQIDSQSGSSRPQSLTSEQELTQYYEQSSDFRRLPATAGGSLTAQSLPIIPVSSSIKDQRSSSAQSLPLVSAQQCVKLERQSMTPDNLLRIPVTGTAVKGTLLPVRTAPMSPAGSRASSRTITPVSAVDILKESRSFENTQKISEMEMTVGNLRKLLAGRDQEVLELTRQIQDLKDRNRSIQEDMENVRNRLMLPSSQTRELEQKFHQMQSEKEILSAEVVKLQDELENQRKERERALVEDSPSINSYNPNNPFVLQRKIGDLTSQIQDLQEANEAAVAELSISEKKIKELVAENEQIQTAHNIDRQEKEEENRRLNQELVRLKEQQSYSYNEVSEHRLKIELQQVREDNRTLRERNYQLHDESLQQKEEIDTLRKSIEKMDKRFGSHKQDLLVSRNLPLLEKSDNKKMLENIRDSLPQDRNLQEPSTERSYDKLKYSYKRLDYDSRNAENLNRPEASARLSKIDLSRTEQLKTYSQARITKSDRPSSHEPFRSRPDGGVMEKAGVSTFESSESNERSLTPRRLSSERIKMDRFDGLRSNANKYQFMEKTRTSSGEQDVKSLTVSYPDLTKTSPPLLERAREEIQHQSTSALPAKTLSPYILPTYSHTSAATTSTHHRHPLDHYGNKRDKETDRIKNEKAYDPRHTTQSYNDDADSDTATDILVNAHPLEQSSWRQNLDRHGSIGSDASVSSFSDIDDQLSSSSRKRSKSADERVTLRRMSPAGGTQSNPGTPVRPTDRLISRSSTTLTNVGFRSITPKPLQTQHNKTTISSVTSHKSLEILNFYESGSSITTGLHPFAPRSPGDIHVNDVVKFSRQGGKLSQGTVKFIGHLPGRGDVYLGVELDKEEGKHDGTFESIRYFKCKPNKGVFVAYNKVVMAWTTY